MKDKRLIDVAFPIQQASLDSVHEKNMRHGHISTLHIWPARRPLAACRAAILATLLPDPGETATRKALVERIGGRITRSESKGKVKVATEGGVLHWGLQTGPEIDAFRKEIQAAFGGRAPKVLDPFAGGGAIPLEAMRLGCDVTAVDVNPVAWTLLRCTLEYPQRLGREARALPKFALDSPSFLERYFRDGLNLKGKALATRLREAQSRLFEAPAAGLGEHIRAWGLWVLERAREEIGSLYPAVEGKPTIAYLWARTLKCPQCRATIPLFKTRWVVNTERKGQRNRVLLELKPKADHVEITLIDPPITGKNPQQRRDNDKRLAVGTVSKTGPQCPCCKTIIKRKDYQAQACDPGLGEQLLVVVEEITGSGKGYREGTPADLKAFARASQLLAKVERETPEWIPTEPISDRRPSPNARGMSGLTRFGMDRFDKVFNRRQLLSLVVFAKWTKAVASEATRMGYPKEWAEALVAYLYCALARLADRNSTLCTWQTSAEKIRNTFSRNALTMTTDYAEVSPFASSSGSYVQAVDWVSEVAESCCRTTDHATPPHVICGSADDERPGTWDLIITDPPYYDSVPYADIMDLFYVWARRVLGGEGGVFASALAPREREYIQHAGRLGGDNEKARAFYEDRMYEVFKRASSLLAPDGRFVIVFAHKDPNAWETLVSGIVRAGFVVDASWPIQTERAARILALASAALSSSVWLVCKKRPATARPGWDKQVVTRMAMELKRRLPEYWDAGIRGPDFVWAATGPALEAFSAHPVVKRTDRPDEPMSVRDFLHDVRRLVVDFVVGIVLKQSSVVEALDDVTTYYLLHRHDFGLGEAPVGAAILYAVSCNLSDHDLSDRLDVLTRVGSPAATSKTADNDGEDEGDGGEEDDPSDEDTDGEEAGESESKGAKVKLKPWSLRRRPHLGQARDGKPAPLIDQIHKLMHLWKAGDALKVDEYLEANALRRSPLFKRVLQALIELADPKSDERPILESISNHVHAEGEDAPDKQMRLDFPTEASS